MHIVKDYTIEGCIARGIAVHTIFLQTSTEYPKTEVDFKVGTRPDMMDGFCPTRIPKSRALLLLLADGLFIQVVAHVRHKKSVRFFASLSAPWLVLLAPNVD